MLNRIKMKRTKSKILIALSLIGLLSSCVPKLSQKIENRQLPETFVNATDSINSAVIPWREFFKDSNLVALIDTALKRNQELNINLQELARKHNEILARRGEYLPFVGLNAGAGVDKTARYTPFGANEATTDIAPGVAMPDPVPHLMFGASASWEIDIWNKLHRAKDAALAEYLASQEGRNFMITQLVSEIASSYYELIALDNQLQVLERNIAIQNNALEIVKLQKASSRVNELAVRRFEAQVQKTKAMRYRIRQQIIESENFINYLLGRFPQPIMRSQESILEIDLQEIKSGKPIDLLVNRPDIRAAEKQLEAAKLNVYVARMQFYPSLDLKAGLGMQAFSASYLLTGPESLLYNALGDLSAPLINRRALKANYYNAGAEQIEQVYRYEQKLLKAYMEVSNQVSSIHNLKESLKYQSSEVQALNESISISNDLFRSARADYMEVLMTQRDALESKFELIDTKKEQLLAGVKLYRTLGGGWN